MIMIMMTQAAAEFRELYPLRNHSSLIFICTIIDSKCLTNNCLDFFPPFQHYCTQKRNNFEMNIERWMFLKMAFSDIKQAAGFPFPSRALELISTLVEGIFNMSAPCEAPLPCWWLAHTWASFCSLTPQEAPVGNRSFDWLAAESAGRLYYYHLHLGGGAEAPCPGGLADSPCFVCPIVN